MARKILIAVVAVSVVVVAIAMLWMSSLGAPMGGDKPYPGQAASVDRDVEASAENVDMSVELDNTAAIDGGGDNAVAAVDEVDDGNAAAPANVVEGGKALSPPADVDRGVGAFAELKDMLVDHWYPVEFIAGPNRQSLLEESEDVPLTAPRAVYVAQFMKVTLLDDPGFDIRPTTPAIQDTGRDRTASWQWQVYPKTDGKRTLYAKVEVLEKQADGSFEAIDSFTRRVGFQVKVGTWKGFVVALKNAATAGDLFTTLFTSWKKTLLALAGLIVAMISVWAAIVKPGKSKTPPAPDPEAEPEVEAPTPGPAAGTPGDDPPPDEAEG